MEDKEPKLTETFDNDNLIKNRVVMLTGEINKELSDRIVRQLLILEKSDEKAPVWIYINSPGGDIDAGCAIFDMIRFVSCPVYVLGIGLVASAASLIYVSVPRERRFALPNSSYLIHQPLSGMKGVATDIEIHKNWLSAIKQRLNEILAEGCSKDVAEITADTDRDHWMGAAEAKNYGLVGTIVANRKELNI